MGNLAVSKVERKGKFILKWTPGKELTLNDVLHIPDINKNLIFDSVLSKKALEWPLNLINLYLLRMTCMWERVILLMVFSRPILLQWTNGSCICSQSS